MKRRILLVDGDVRFAKNLASALASDTAWEISTAANATEALVALSQAPCDVVVSDLRLAGADGTLLLSEVMKRHPSAHRVILADLSDKQALTKCVGTVHQFLTKPCDSRQLKAALERAFAFDLWLPDASVQKLVGQMAKLPSPPQLYFQVVKELQSTDASLEAVGDLIARDLAMTAKLLQLANSAAFGLVQAVSTPVEAVTYLGLETTKSMILLAHCFSYFDNLSPSDFSADELWQHSIRVAQLAKTIACAESAPLTVVEQAYTAGTLHDLGKLALVANLPKQFKECLTLSRVENLPACQAEVRVLGATHAEIGAALLATWGLAPGIVEALALHHFPTKLLHKSFCPLTAVHVANALDHALMRGTELQLDTRYLEDLELDSRLPMWRDDCAETLGHLGIPIAA